MGYQPKKSEEEIIKRVYEDFDHMQDERKKRWKYFNDRTLKEYIDDSQLRLNGYVPTREEQGKESWQSNVFHPVTRNKFKAMLAAVALDVPQVKITAQNEKSQRDHKRAKVIKNLVNFSYSQENKEENVFFEGWEAAEKGTVLTYDGYLKAKAKRKLIKSFDTQTGEIETEEEEIETDSQCFEQLVPLMSFYPYDVHIFDVQKQPCVVWLERKRRDDFDQEYGKYKNAKQVPESVPLTQESEDNTFYTERWADRYDKDNPIEVLKYYNKIRDEYIVIANGVLILNVPLLLGKKKKWYPFAKTVFEPIAGDFFYGKSLPDILMGEQDVINALYNMALDKTYKSMAPALLIGNTNKDDFDLEDQNTTIDTKIYVQDIAQVREMPISGIDQADLKMIELVSRGLDLSSVDSNQSGVPGRGVTAREVVIANENAKKLKGIMYLFLTSLWIQKIKLRIMNILVYYPKPKVKEILGESDKDNMLDEYQSFSVENAELDGGIKGTMGIEIYPSEEELPSKDEADIRAMTYRERSNENYDYIAIAADYLDNWIYDVKVISESVFQQESSLSQIKMQDKLNVLATFFPQLLMMNQKKLATDVLTAYDDDADEYTLEQAPVMPGAMPGQEPGAAEATAGQAGLPTLPPI